ncbi:tyrosine-type recombinase/integrase [Vibrio coralliilyticus]|uniref:tyrosine-type recombinase/integrase n=1 Tax=Vibrio coralliilyticus TaxID=190893 RepID=UPI000BAC2839|nr:tyrosine-type recombinase/integrase [Vibrio coralliilyticus]NOI77528.1 tyrosine-type recombinase/integrase [Vibrio coralliilyticus]PAW02573.1 integrase [Vibrio coralliilyticus]
MSHLLHKLTAKEVKEAKGREKPYRINDGGGLYLLVKPNKLKYWEFRYKNRITGKTTMLGLGSLDVLTLKQARDKAHDMRVLLNEGIDPKQYRLDKKAKLKEELASTFFVVAEGWIETKSKLKPKTIQGNWRKLELYAFPKFGDIPVSNLTPMIVQDALKPLANQGKLETVKRTIQLVNEVMNYAINSGLLQHNVLAGVGKTFESPEVKHMAALKPHEITELLQTVATANMYIATKCLIEFQLHTMTRPGEAAGARWEEIDFDNKLWIISEARMKMKREHRIPLTEQTLAILERMRPVSGNRVHVFPSMRFPKRSIDSETINKALSRIGFKSRTTAHGMRSLASTTLNEKGFAPDVIEAALAHQDRNAIRAAYNRTDYLARRRKMMEWWSNYIDEAAIGSLSMASKVHLKAVS